MKEALIEKSPRSITLGDLYRVVLECQANILEILKASNQTPDLTGLSYIDSRHDIQAKALLQYQANVWNVLSREPRPLKQLGVQA